MPPSLWLYGLPRITFPQLSTRLLHGCQKFWGNANDSSTPAYVRCVRMPRCPGRDFWVIPFHTFSLCAYQSVNMPMQEFIHMNRFLDKFRDLWKVVDFPTHFLQAFLGSPSNFLPQQWLSDELMEPSISELLYINYHHKRPHQQFLQITVYTQHIPM